MRQDEFVQKWATDLALLEDAYHTIDAKQTAKIWLPTTFCMLIAASIFILMFLYDVFHIHIYAITFLMMVLLSIVYYTMEMAYIGHEQDAAHAFETIEFVYSLSPDILSDYVQCMEASKYNYSHKAIGYVPATDMLIQKYRRAS